MAMKIGILGTRGIPNHYGGFEQFTERLSVGLIQRGHEVWVYNSHTHPVKDKIWQGVNRVLCFDPECLLGTPGQFIYDLNCILDSQRRDFDIILQLGYTSSSVWHNLLPRRSKIVTNMDGLEWQRSKYSRPARRFLHWAERLAVTSSDALIADSEAIRDYLGTKYRVKSSYIPYGADPFQSPDEGALAEFGVDPWRYFLVIARMQPDNHIAEIIRGVLLSDSDFPLLVIGNTGNTYGRFLVRSFQGDRIRFPGPVFDKQKLDNLRYFSRLYFHGHSSGGTNPSLLEAMAASATICAHDNLFNREVLGDHGFFFRDQAAVAGAINEVFRDPGFAKAKTRNLARIRSSYRWDHVIGAYEKLFTGLLHVVANGHRKVQDDKNDQ
jgi:glycosyltransferase involved in cell wall biosynthesis